jgi:plasmid replication initiation protein
VIGGLDKYSPVLHDIFNTKNNQNMPSQKPHNNRQIIVSNQINEARFKMTRSEQRLFLYCIGIIDNKEDRLNLTFTLKIEEFKQFLELKRNDFHTEMRSITKQLAGRVLEIKHGDRLRQIPVLSLVDYNQGEVTIKVNSELAPFLIELKNNFTQFSLKEVLKFKSLFSMRIYQLLCQHAYKNEVIYSVEELRFILDIEPHKFTRYNDFKKDVLDRALSEINLNSTLKFTYKEIKTSRKITAIHFIIKKLETTKEVIKHPQITQSEEYKSLPDKQKIEINKTKSDQLKELENDEKGFVMIPEETKPVAQSSNPFYFKLIDLGYSAINANKILSEYSNKYLEFVYDKSKIETRTTVTNKAGYFGTLLVDYKQDYQDELESLKREEQRAIDYENNRVQREKEKQEAEARFIAEQPSLARAILEEEPELFCKYIYGYMQTFVVTIRSSFVCEPSFFENYRANNNEQNIQNAINIRNKFLQCQSLRDFSNLIKYDYEWLFKAVFDAKEILDPEDPRYYRKAHNIPKVELPFKV